MKIGMNLLLWTGDPTEEAYLPVCEKLKKFGFDGVELPIFNMVPERYAALGKRLQDMGLECTGVTVRNAEDDPMSPDPAIRAKGIANTKLALDCCHAAGATILAGPYHSAIGRFSGAGATQEEVNCAVESMKEVAAYAGQTNVTLALEFINRFECYLLTCAEEAVDFVEKVNHPACKTMWDTFHAHIEQKNINQSMKKIRPHMAHFHISENDRSTPGRGQVDWKTTFDSVIETGYDGWLTVEAFGQALPELAAATKIWRRMFDTEEKLAEDACKFIKSELARRR